MKTRILFPKNIWYNKAFKGLTTTSKVVSLYLISNENIGLTRYYQQHDLEVCFLFSIGETELAKVKTELEDSKLFYFKDEWVYINNNFAYVDYDGRDRLMEAKQKEMDRIPTEILKHIQLVIKGLSTPSQPPINNKYKIIKNKRGELRGESKETQEILSFTNELFGREFKSSREWRKNFEKAREVYSLEDIKKAITSWSKGGFVFTDKDGGVIQINLSLLFRPENRKGEPVDYISQLVNRRK